MMAYHPLLNALVAPAQQIGHQRPAGVGMPHQLPAQIRFGSVAPGLAQNSPFSGGRVAAPGSPLQPTPAETFSPPAQTAGPAASSLAPFMQTPQGGSPTPVMTDTGAGGFTGGTAPAPEPGRTPTPTTPIGLNTQQIAQANASLTGNDPNYHATGGALGTTMYGPLAQGAYWGALGTPATTPNSLSTLMAALSSSGQKLNPSTGAHSIRL